jgi:hypothetical protein
VHVEVTYLGGFAMVAITFELLELGLEVFVAAFGTVEGVLGDVLLSCGTTVTTVFAAGVLCALPRPCHWLGRRAISSCGVGLRSIVRVRHGLI